MKILRVTNSLKGLLVCKQTALAFHTEKVELSNSMAEMNTLSQNFPLI